MCLSRIGVVFAMLVTIAPVGDLARAHGTDRVVDAAIVLAADVSRSINDDEFDLQRRGYAGAITSAQVMDAIKTGGHGAVALCFVEWAGEAEQKVVVEWAVIRNDADARRFADALLAAPRSYLGRTAIGSAIDFASGLTYALNGGMQRIADKVFMLTPRNVEISAEERARLIEKGFFNQS